ncbi:MAG TPA: AgmX/PglI C-terminal domain-containing protein [Kofleriaceae bacterium]|jgi:outer membrane biosynthesis protein TonB|nr:AgmX/PglI C-terminal domain-containing protein [Kofleriaceae bacterium]
MSDDYLWNRSGIPDPDIKQLEELLVQLAHDAPFDEVRGTRVRKRELARATAHERDDLVIVDSTTTHAPHASRRAKGKMSFLDKRVIGVASLTAAAIVLVGLTIYKSRVAGDKHRDSRDDSDVALRPNLVDETSAEPIGDPVGGIDADKPMIRHGIKGAIQKIEGCYEKQLLVDPSLEGTVRATFTINADGKVSGSSATGVHDAVASCVAGVISTIQFDKPIAGATTVKYPFVFRSQGVPPPPATSNASDDDRVMIRRYIKQQLSAIQECYEKQLAGQPDLAGTVTVKLTIAANGKVIAATGSGLQTNVDACVANVVKAIQFGTPSRAPIDISYPFTFTPASTDSQPTATGTLDPDKAMIRRIIHLHIQSIQYCYEQRLLEQPALQGTIQAKFTVDADGKVGTSTASGLDAQVASCVAAVIKGLPFERPSKPMEISYPFSFSPAQ